MKEDKVNHPDKVEVWKPAKGFELYLEVSNLGNVKRIPRKVNSSFGAIRTCGGNLIKLSIGKRGYYCISLHDKTNNINKILYVHRLVAQTFIENPNNLICVNHKDENKLNNCVDNLEWCTEKYNLNYGTARSRSKETLIKLLKKSIPVLLLDLDGNVINEFPSARHAARILGYSSSASIVNVLKGRKQTTHGCKWQYKKG